jgi:Bacterial Ig-like domain (group 3)/MBG domain (YGX type)/NHL repeat
MVLSRRCGASLVISVFLILFFLLVPHLSLAQAVTVVHTGTRAAGTGSAGYSSDYGAATTLSLNAPSYIVFDSNGNQYLSDTLNNCVRKIDTAGNMTTVAGLAVSGQSSDTCNTSSNVTPTTAQGLYHPTGLAIDSSNRLYIADSLHNCIRMLNSGSTGVASLTTVAGTCGSVYTASVTPAPNGLAIDSNNNLYISLQDASSTAPVNQVVRHGLTDSTSTVCLMAGAASANVSASCSGINNTVVLSGPSGLAIDANNNLYIADTGNNCIREIAGMTTQQTAVGQCVNDATGSSATMIRNPYGLAVSPTQALLISESNPDNVVSFNAGNGSVAIVAGLPNGVAGAYYSNEDGKSALNASLNSPRGLAFDSLAHLFVADSLNNITRELSSNMQLASTPVGSQSATLPVTFAINQAVNLSISASSDFTITSTTCTGAMSAAAAGSAPNTCQVFGYFAPGRPGLRRAVLKLTDSISGTTVFQGLQGTGTGSLSVFVPGSVTTLVTHLSTPAAIATDATGNVYVLETGNNADLLMLSGNAVVGAGKGLRTPTAMAADAAGDWFVVDATHGTVARFGVDGSVNTNYATGLDMPTAVAIDRFNNLYVAQTGSSHNVIEIYVTGARRVIAGSGSNSSADGVPAATAALVLPSALTIDLNGKLSIADLGGHQVYTVDQSGIIHIVATGSQLTPVSLATDAAADLYIADQAGHIYAAYANAGSENLAVVLDGSGTNGVLAGGPVSIALDGNGNIFATNATTNTVVELNYSNPILNFGTVNAGTTSAVMTQQLGNIGTDSLNITSPFSTTDSHFPVNSNTTTCGTTILPGAVCALSFSFSPTAGVAYTAASVIASNSYNTPQTIQLLGNGRDASTLTVTLPAESEVYGNAFSAAVTFNGATVAPTGTISFATAGQTLCSVTGNLGVSTTCNAANSGLSAGTYNMTFNYSGDSNYTAVSGTTILTVTKASLTIVVSAATRSYGAANPTFKGTKTGTVPGDNILLAYSTTATVKSSVGSYPITTTLTAIGTTDLNNYNVINTPGSLMIIPSTAMVINVDSATRVYGAANPTFAGSMTGVLNNDNITVAYSTLATTASSTGRYMIGASISGDAAANYTPAVNQGALTITPAATATTMTTSNPSVTLGDSITFTANVTSATGMASGTVNFYDGTTLLGNGSLSSGATTFTTTSLAAGSHSISAAFQANVNFNTSGSAMVGQTIKQPVGSFVISPLQTEQYVRGAGATTYQINLQATGAFTGKIALACSGLPADSTCSFSNATPNLTPGGAASVTMTVTNTISDAKLQKPSVPMPASFAPVTAAMIFPFELAGAGLCFSGMRRKSLVNRKQLFIILFLLIGMIGLTGCGAVTTPYKSYTISVTGTPVSFPSAPVTTSVVLSVGQQVQ